MAKRGQGEGSIYKRADGRWEAIASIGNGKRKSFYGKTRVEVARKLTEALQNHQRGLPTVSEVQTVGQYLTSWLQVVQPTVKRRTYASYEQLTRTHLRPAFGMVRLSRLSPQQIQELYAAKLSAGLSPTTVRHIHAVLHTALAAALRLGLLQRNPSDMVDPPRMHRHDMVVLSADQARLLLDVARGDRLEAIYVLALSTGMREGELLALHWRDVDLDRATLQVRYTLELRTRSPGTHRDVPPLFGEPKSARGRRKITLPATAVEALRAHRARQAEERLALGPSWDDLDLVFPNTIGRPIHPGNLLRRSLRPLLARAGLPTHMRFHDLRHTAATLLLGRGINPKIVSELLGHASIAITLDIYSHVLPDMQQQAAAAMDDLLARSF